MASPAFGSKSDLTGSSTSGTVTIAVPSGVAANDILVLAIYHENSNSVTATGFTVKDTATADNHKLTVLWKRASGADSGTYSIALGAGAAWVTGACLRITGCVTSGDPFDVTNTAVSNTNTNTSPNVAVTTTVADTLLVYAGTNFGGGPATPPSGMTERTDISDDLETATQAQAAAGSSGNKGASAWSVTNHSTSWLGALKSTAGDINPAAESAAGTGAANNATVTISLTAESAAGTGTANGATVSYDSLPLAESAAGTGAANNATITVSLAAGSAAGTGVANDAKVSISLTAESASGAGAAYGASTSSGAIPPAGIDGVAWAVEIAADGAQITDDDLDSATWTDVTCRAQDPITLTVGRQRAGERAPARKLSLSLNNDDGYLSPDNAASPWYPNVDQGMPIRFWRRNSAGVFKLRATVALDELNLDWPDGLEDQCLAVIAASGPLRWLDQGDAAPVAAGTATATASTTALAVWPCTDGASATSAANSVMGGMAASRTTSDVKFGQITGPDGVLKYPDMRTSGRIRGKVPTTATTTEWTVTGRVTGASVTGWLSLLYWTTTSTSAPAWRVRYDIGGPLTVRWIASTESSATETTVITVSTDPFAGSNAANNWITVRVTAVQSGGNVAVKLYVDDVEVGSGTATSVTTGRVTEIFLGDWDGPGGGFVSGGDLAVYTAAEVPAAASVASDYAGELAHVRWLRLAAELGVRATCGGTLSVEMGAQSEQPLVDALAECEDSEHGLQADTADGSLLLVTTREMYNLDPAITLDVDAGHLGIPFGATRSDSTVANDVTITRKGGSSRRVVKPARRTYTDSDNLSLFTDDLAGAAASWRANAGTLRGARVETLTWDCESSPDLLDDTLALVCGMWLAAVNLPSQYPGGETSLLLQGWTEVHSESVFGFTAFGSPTDLYRVGTIAEDGGDPADTDMRIDSDTSTLDTGINAVTTSIVVASTYGWSTIAEPYDWDIDGEQITVTSMGAYAAGKQTATVTRAVNGIAKTHDAGATISLWRPYRIGY